MWRWLVGLVALVTLGVACADPADEPVSRGTVPAPLPTGAAAPGDAALSGASPESPDGPAPTPDGAGSSGLPPASTVPLGSAIYDPAEHRAPAAPTAIAIPSLDIVAPVRSVGLEPDGAMEVPPPAEVGWFEPGVVPGDAGSAVLAGHIAYDGEDGAFRYLADIAIDAEVEVYFDDGTTARFRVVGVQEYRKDELPVDAIFSRETVRPMVALITCGGDFNPELRSYESNVVAFAVAI